jgi:carbonic anhydrase
MNMRSIPQAFLFVALVLGAGCGAPPGALAPSGSPHHASWSYDGPTGPERWGDLEPAYAACSQGREQSPIDLPGPEGLSTASTARLQWGDPVPLTILNNGHTVQVDAAVPSSLALDGVSYSLAQFHFHVPAEHTLAGRVFDAELHLVHRAPGGKVAVVALLIREGAENQALRPVFESLPMEPAAPRTVPGKAIDVGAIVPRSPRFLSYDGSLTTPPCTEGVRWLVALPEPAPLELAKADLARLRAAVHAPTHRPPQPRNDRAVVLRTP